MSTVRIIVDGGAFGEVEVQREDYIKARDTESIGRLIDEAVNQARNAYGLDAR